MASWQAHALDAIFRITVKRRLERQTDFATVRAAMNQETLASPKGARFQAETLGGVPGEWVEAGAAQEATLLYLHGGGYFACSPRTHRAITAAYAQHGFRVYAPEYRLAPEHPFPAALEDAAAAYRALLERGFEASRIALSGDLAGGGLAVALLFKLRRDGVALPAAAALLSPWTDLAVTGESIRVNALREAMLATRKIPIGASYYLNGTDPRTPLASPLYGDFAGLPPLIVHVGDREALRDDSTRLVERARAAAVHVELKIWPVVPHVFQLAQVFVPEARRSLAEMAAFLHEAIASAPAQRG